LVLKIPAQNADKLKRKAKMLKGKSPVSSQYLSGSFTVSSG